MRKRKGRYIYVFLSFSCQHTRLSNLISPKRKIDFLSREMIEEVGVAIFLSRIKVLDDMMREQESSGREFWNM